MMIESAVQQLRAATELTMSEIIGVSALPDTTRTPEVCFSLGVLAGAATALGATRQEMLDDLGLLTAPQRQPSA